MSALPLWARALRGFDRLAWYAYHAHEIARDEVLFAYLRPELRQEATVAAYSEMRTYLPGGSTFEGGLFGWEEALLTQADMPRSGRILLAAAGGGRELKALLDRGFRVTAFEPNPVLLRGAQQVAASASTEAGAANVVQATYTDLVTAATTGEGPLASLRRQTFDGVLFGWGSFTHLTQPELQLAVLRAARELAPEAPLALSFFMRPANPLESRSLKMRRGLRQAFARLGKPETVAPGLGYDYGGGFVYSFTIEELEKLSEGAGYRIGYRDEQSFPHLILLPQAG